MPRPGPAAPPDPEELLEKWADPALLEKQLEALHTRAESGDVKAVELYWKLVDRIAPPREDDSSQLLESLTDSELDELIVDHARREKARRAHDI